MIDFLKFDFVIISLEPQFDQITRLQVTNMEG